MSIEPAISGDERDATLGVLVCEYGKRPKGAPSFFDLADAIRGIRRSDATLTVEFDPARRAEVESLVAAETLCCTEIGWDLATSPSLTLRISATAAQLDIFEQFLALAT